MCTHHNHQGHTVPAFQYHRGQDVRDRLMSPALSAILEKKWIIHQKG